MQKTSLKGKNSLFNHATRNIIAVILALPLASQEQSPSIKAATIISRPTEGGIGKPGQINPGALTICPADLRKKRPPQVAALLQNDEYQEWLAVLFGVLVMLAMARTTLRKFLLLLGC